MTARKRGTDEHLVTIAGALLGTLSLFALITAPIGVLLGGNVFELGVVAISGVGLSLLHLAVVVALHARATRPRPLPQSSVVSIGDGSGYGGSSAGPAGDVLASERRG